MSTPPISPCGRAAARPDRHPGADGPGPCGSFGDGRGEQGEGRGGEHGGAEALCGAGGEQLPALLGESACQGGGGEEAEADEEHQLAAVQVGGPPAEEHEPGERDRVGVEHPLEPGGAQPQVRAHGGECDVDDGHVEDDEELADAGGEHHRPGAGSGTAGTACGRRDVNHGVILAAAPHPVHRFPDRTGLGPAA